MDRFDQPWLGDDSGARLHELPDLRLAHAAELDPSEMLVTNQAAERLGQRMTPRHLHVPVGRQEQDSHGHDVLRDEFQQRQRRSIGPVKVLENQEEWRLPGGALQEGRYRVEEAEASLRGVLQRRRRHQVVERDAQLRNELRDLGGARAHHTSQSLGVVTLDIAAQHLDPRPVGGCALALVAVAAGDPNAALGSHHRQLLAKARLADSGLAHHRGERALSRRGQVQGEPELSKL